MSIIRLIFIFLAFNAFCQNGWEDVSLTEFSEAILKAESEIEKNTSYSYQTVYNFFDNLTATQAELTMKASLICAESRELFMSQFGRLMVQNDKINVVCDTANRTMIVSEAKKEYLKRKSSSDFDLLLSSASTLKKKNEAKQTKFYLEFPEGGKYIAAEIWFANNHQVDKYILYTANETLDDSKEEDRYIRPRLEIDYSNYRYGENVKTDQMLRIKDFIIIDQNGIALQDAYSDYKLIDLRTLNN